VKRLAPCGNYDVPASMTMVGKGKAVPRLVERMPSAEIVAKVGATGQDGMRAERTHRVVRRKILAAQD